jgi:hypothetical protein
MHDDTPQPQGELPLGLDRWSPAAVTGKRRALFAFLASNRRQILAMGLTGACLLWGSWTTHKLLGLEQRVTTIRKVALADLVRDYVQAEAAAAPHPTRSRRKPALPQSAQPRVARHAAQGEVLLLSNAVVAGDVPDITPQVRDEVYASLPSRKAGLPHHQRRAHRSRCSSSSMPREPIMAAASEIAPVPAPRASSWRLKLGGMALIGSAALGWSALKDWHDHHAFLINASESLPTGRCWSRRTLSGARRLCRFRARP